MTRCHMCGSERATLNNTYVVCVHCDTECRHQYCYKCELVKAADIRATE